MATAAVIDFGSISSLSGNERVLARFGARVEPGEFVDFGSDQCSAEFEGIVGTSPALRRGFHQVRIVAPTGATVLMEGETGTGKELITRAIHMLSDRRDRPFVKVKSHGGHSDFVGALVPSIAPAVESIARLHDELLSGRSGRLVNGIGGLCLLLLCLTCAAILRPGVRNWRRCLTMNERAHFARVFPKLARDLANGGGRTVWRNRLTSPGWIRVTSVGGVVNAGIAVLARADLRQSRRERIACFTGFGESRLMPRQIRQMTWAPIGTLHEEQENQGSPAWRIVERRMHM